MMNGVLGIVYLYTEIMGEIVFIQLSVYQCGGLATFLSVR